MHTPIQAPLMPRAFMQEIVGRSWSPETDGEAKPAGGKKGRRRKKTAENLCLIQLLTFAVCPPAY